MIIWVLSSIVFVIITCWLYTDYRHTQLSRDQAVLHSDTMVQVHQQHNETVAHLKQLVVERDEDIRALTLAISQSKESIPVIYPRRGPLEPGSGYFDGKPKLRDAGPPLPKHKS